MSSPYGALVRVSVMTVSDSLGHDRHLHSHGFAVQQQYGAESVRGGSPRSGRTCWAGCGAGEAARLKYA